MGESSYKATRVYSVLSRNIFCIVSKYSQKWLSSGFGLMGKIMIYRGDLLFCLKESSGTLSNWVCLNNDLPLDLAEQEELCSLCKEIEYLLKKHRINRIKLSPTIFNNSDFSRATCFDFLVKYTTGDVLLDFGFSMGSTVIQLPYKDKLGGAVFNAKEMILLIGDPYYNIREAVAGMFDSLYYIEGYTGVSNLLSNNSIGLQNCNLSNVFRKAKEKVPCMSDMYLFLPDPKKWVYRYFIAEWGRIGINGNTAFVYPALRGIKTADWH